MAVPITPVRLGDVVRLKKPHPCGTNEWEITKLGMDIGLACVGCGRKVRLERYEFDRRFRGFIRRPGGDEGDRPADAPGASGGGAGGGAGGDETSAPEGARGGTGGGAG